MIFSMNGQVQISPGRFSSLLKKRKINFLLTDIAFYPNNSISKRFAAGSTRGKYTAGCHAWRHATVSHNVGKVRPIEIM